jgi:ATP-dependent DNA helicase RecQ
LDPLEILQKYWSYPDFRSPQREIIDSILSGKDTVALLATGAGKSICFQVPALCLPGVCLVISPLIALMQDQVARLKELGIQAAAIHSGMHWNEMDAVLSRARYGDLKLLYLSPERLETKDSLEAIQSIPISLIAVDEAHCISQWGHDFRPAYLKIAGIREYTKAPILALTATATQKTREEICTHLKLVAPAVFETSFRRKNLSLLLYEEEQKMEALLHFLKPIKESAIVYSRNRRQTIVLAQFLVQSGISARGYHAGLSTTDRNQIQKDWIANKTQVVIATNAFGMGIDKPDVRLVVHLDLPQGLEEYFQEAGRAGRDQKKSYAVLLYNQQDINRLQQQWIDQFPDEDYIREVYRCLALHYEIPEGAITNESFDFDVLEFSKRFKFKPLICLNALKILEQNERIALTEGIRSPSRLQIIADIETLNSYRNRDPKLDLLIQALFRNYEGIFSVAVQIQEQSLVSICQLDLEKIIQLLKYLHSEQLVDYHPAGNKPQVLFINTRIRSTVLTINKVLFQQQKERMKFRIQWMLDLLSTNKCRQVFIAMYFGQESGSDCGMCDNCLAKTLGKPDKQLYLKWKQLILDALNTKPSMTYREILHLFPINKKSWVESIVQDMVLEQDLIRQHELIRLNPNRNPPS